MKPVVSDHALLRYIERAHGVDVEALRAHVAGLVQKGVDLGAPLVVVEGVRFVLDGKRVVTVLQRKWIPDYDRLTRRPDR